MICKFYLCLCLYTVPGCLFLATLAALLYPGCCDLALVFSHLLATRSLFWATWTPEYGWLEKKSCKSAACACSAATGRHFDKKILRFFSTSSSLYSSYEIDTPLEKNKSNHLVVPLKKKFKDLEKYNKILVQQKILNVIKGILLKGPANHDTQLEIEKLVFNGFKELYSDPDSIVEILGGFNPKIFSNPKLIKFIHSTIKTIEDLFYTLKLSIKDELIKKKSKIAREHLRLLYSILYVIKKKDLVSILISTLFRIITYNMVINTDDKDDAFIPTGLLNLSINLGEKIVDLFIRIKYKEVSRNIKLKEFKDNLIKETSLNNTEFLVYIGGELIKIMKECGLIEDKVVSIKSERNVSVLILTEEIRDLLGDGIINKAISIPMNLPMIVEPKDYKDILHLSDGGYLLNNEEIIHPLFTDNLLQNGKTIIFKSNKVLESINGIMKVPFKINTELLNYILNTPGFINKDIYPPFYDVKKRNKVQESEYQKWLSEKILNDFIISIADTYSNVPEIYFPLMMDFRGRIYPRVTYLNYQGSQLAKSLLLFAYPGSIKRNNIKAIEYLKSYGAACFGHGLDKKSYKERLLWIDKNWNDIIRLNNEFILTAENKFSFLAFCLEAKRFDNFYYSCNSSVFSTYLPIQLDASCNGFQHLALLSDEVGLFEELNLSESDEPKDFYTFILNKVNTHLQAKLVKLEGEDKLCVIRLLNLSLKRSNLKQLIMTKPYNASLYSMTNYLADSLVYRGVGKFIHVNNERHLVLNSTLKKDELNTNDQNIIPDEYKEYLKYTNDQTKVTSVKTAKARLSPRVVKSKAKRSKIKGLNTIVENENMDNSSIKDSNIPLTSDKSSVSNTIPEKEEKEYIYSTSDSSDDLVTRLDLFYYVNEFNNILLNSFPHIKRLIEYLDLISNILSELNLPIVWKLPHGLKVSQRYVTRKSKKIKPYTFSGKEITLSIIDKSTIDRKKQRNALMPNLVHSLDSTSMLLLYYSLKHTKNNVNFYSVHDCFGVTADNVETLIDLIKKVYINIYSDNKYIEKFDEDVIKIILIYYGGSSGQVTYDKDSRKISFKDGRDAINLPKVPLNTDMNINIIKDYYKKLSKSKLLIN